MRTFSNVLKTLRIDRGQCPAISVLISCFIYPCLFSTCSSLFMMSISVLRFNRSVNIFVFAFWYFLVALACASVVFMSSPLFSHTPPRNLCAECHFIVSAALCCSLSAIVLNYFFLTRCPDDNQFPHICPFCRDIPPGSACAVTPSLSHSALPHG